MTRKPGPKPKVQDRPLRFATYNVEWFNALFDNRGNLLEDREYSARYNITRAEQIGSLAIVFTALDADGVMIIEAPDTNHRRSTVRALENFAQKFDLRCRKAVIGFASETEQEIADSAFDRDPDDNDGDRSLEENQVVEFDIDPRSLEEFSEQATRVIREFMDRGLPFVLVTSPETRSYVRMIIERLFATLPVLSHVELAKGIEIKILGSIS